MQSFLSAHMLTCISTEANLSVEGVDSQSVTNTISASLFALSKPIILYSSVMTLAAMGPGSGEDSSQSKGRSSSTDESGSEACVAVWLGDKSQPVLASDMIDRS